MHHTTRSCRCNLLAEWQGEAALLCLHPFRAVQPRARCMTIWWARQFTSSRHFICMAMSFCCVQAYIKLKNCPASKFDTACALAGMLAGFIEWVAAGMLGYNYRQKKEAVVSSRLQL